MESIPDISNNSSWRLSQRLSIGFGYINGYQNYKKLPEIFKSSYSAKVGVGIRRIRSLAFDAGISIGFMQGIVHYRPSSPIGGDSLIILGRDNYYFVEIPIHFGYQRELKEDVILGFETGVNGQIILGFSDLVNKSAINFPQLQFSAGLSYLRDRDFSFFKGAKLNWIRGITEIDNDWGNEYSGLQLTVMINISNR